MDPCRQRQQTRLPDVSASSESGAGSLSLWGRLGNSEITVSWGEVVAEMALHQRTACVNVIGLRGRQLARRPSVDRLGCRLSSVPLWRRTERLPRNWAGKEPSPCVSLGIPGTGLGVRKLPWRAETIGRRRGFSAPDRAPSLTNARNHRVAACVPPLLRRDPRTVVSSGHPA